MNEVFQNQKLVRVFIALLAVATIFMAVKTVNEWKKGSYIGREPGTQNTITVTGDGESFVKPDIAIFSFSVTEERKTVAEAQRAATEKTNKAVTALKNKDISEKDIKTTGYNIYPKYENQYASERLCTSTWCPPYPSKQVISGYEVSQSIEVKVRDLEKAGDLLSTVGALNVSNVSGLSFEVENKEAYLAKARADAIKEARKKAETLADDLDVSLVRITSFSEGGNYPIYYGRGAVMSMKADVAESAPAPEIPAGENKFTSNVTITYEIR